MSCQFLSDEKWFLKQTKNETLKPIQTTIPTTVHLDLIKNKIIEDPYIQQNESKQKWIGKSDWEYYCLFKVEKNKLSEEFHFLVFEGLDTVGKKKIIFSHSATIFLNDKILGNVENMFLKYEFEISKWIQEENNLRIKFKSPCQFSMDKSKDCDYEIPCPTYVYGEKHRNFIRKCGSDFGWDWGPCISSIGIYKNIYLLSGSFPVLKSVNIFQKIMWNDKKEAKNVELTFKIKVFSPINCKSNLYLELPNINESMEINLLEGLQTVEFKIQMENPSLWFPTGYGEPFLYSPNLILKTNENLSKLTTKLGIREVYLDTTKDEYGSRFRFNINKIDVFCKGASK
jgi:beta-mannosidase